MRTEVAGFSATLRHAREQAVATQRPHPGRGEPRRAPRDRHRRRGRRAPDARARPSAHDRGHLAARPSPSASSPTACRAGATSASARASIRLPGQRGSADRTRARITPVSDRRLPAPCPRIGTIKRGFTLLEVLVALAILGTAVVAVDPGREPGAAPAQGGRRPAAGDHRGRSEGARDRSCRSRAATRDGRPLQLAAHDARRRDTGPHPGRQRPAVASVPDLRGRHLGRAAPPRGLDPAHRAGDLRSHPRHDRIGLAPARRECIRWRLPRAAVDGHRVRRRSAAPSSGSGA